MLDAFMALANTKGGAGALTAAAQGIFGGDPGPVVSGAGGVDARAFLDGSGWTVSTGKSSASGATISRSGDPFGPSSTAGPMQAGASPVLAWAIGGVMLALIVRALKKG